MGLEEEFGPSIVPLHGKCLQTHLLVGVSGEVEEQGLALRPLPQRHAVRLPAGPETRGPMVSGATAVMRRAPDSLPPMQACPWSPYYPYY